MSSLLQRLASAAIGTASPALHPMARIPYMPPTPMMPAEGDTTAPPPLKRALTVTNRIYDVPDIVAMQVPRPSNPCPSPPSQQAESGTVDIFSGTPPEPAQPAHTQVPGTHGTARLTRPPSALETERISLPLDLPSPAPAALRLAPNRSATVLPVPEHPATTTVQPAALRLHIEPHPYPARSGIEHAAPQRPIMDPEPPKALFPQAAANAGSNPRGAVTFRPANRPQAAPSEAKAEVHVHIGRIEVTAVHRSAEPPPRNPPSRPQPMSLNEYLARRGGRQP